MRTWFVVSLIVCLAVIPAAGRAQNVSVFGLMSYPLGDFGADNSEKAGYAKAGYGGGVEFAFPLEMSAMGLYLVGQVGVIFNPIDEAKIEAMYREDMELLLSLIDPDLSLSRLDLSAGSYMNVPVLAGVRYETEISPGLKFYGKGLGGINVAKLPELTFPMTIVYDDGVNDMEFDLESKITSERATSFCLALGAGVIISDRIDIGLEYLNMGEPSFNGTVTMTVEGDSFSESF